MTTTWDMEAKKGWNFSAFSSIASAFDGMVGAYGDKGELGNIACFLALSLTERQRKEMRRLLKIAVAEAESDDRSVLEHMRRLAAPVTIAPTPPVEEPTLPPLHRPSLEAEMIQDSDEIFEEESKVEDKKHPPKSKKGTKRSA